MPHGDLAQVAAVIGAIGSLLVLLPRTRGPLLGGFAVLAAAELMLAIALVPRSDLDRLHRPVGLASLVVVALAGIALAAAFVRWPPLAPIALLLAAPFRVSIDLGSQHAFLLIPLYGVLAAAALAFCWRLVTAQPRPVTPWLAYPVAAFIALSGLSLVWSHDLKAGSIELVFFLFPFAALFAIVARMDLPDWLPGTLGTTLVALTVLFALVGLVQRATHTQLYAPSLEVDNAFTSYFRVSSFFKDPSLFGRYLALGIAVVVSSYLLGRVRLAIVAPVLIVEFAALWFSYSQSSMVTVFIVVAGLALVAGTREMRRVVLAVAAVIVIAATAVVAVHVRNDSARKFTSDRSRLVSVTWHVFENHPVVGVGVGGQPKASRDEVARRLAASRNKSHTSALTVAAELGLVGVLVYLAFLAGAATSLHAVYGRDQALGLGLAAVFVTLLIHSFFYAGFFEDPLTWGALAVAAAALAVLPAPARPQAGRDGAPTGDVATLDGSPADRPTPLAADRVES
jgi:putative inorganic carbon (hco3(-)) transporter